MNQVDDAETRIKDVQRVFRCTRTEAFNYLNLEKWHHFFDGVYNDELTVWCREFAEQFNNATLSESSQFLRKTCEDPRFGVYIMPRRSLTTHMKDGELYFKRKRTHAGLMVPFEVDYESETASYRRMFISYVSDELIIHELAHAMEPHRVRYTSENHDGEFWTFYSELIRFYRSCQKREE